MTDVKICGIQNPETLNAATQNWARFVGFVFYEPSPRHLRFDTAWNLARMIPTGVRSVGLFVNPDDSYLDRIATGVQLDMIQLHGDESPGRVQEIKQRYNMPVIKVIQVRDASDLKQLKAYESVSDWILFDAKVDGERGGTGHVFDWTVLQGVSMNRPWMLSGGLNINNVKDALSVLKPNAVDVSSGVESARGIKDERKIIDFIKQVKANG